VVTHHGGELRCGPIPLLARDGLVAERHLQLPQQLVCRQKALHASQLLAVGSQHEHGGRPTRAEAMERRRLLLDVQAGGGEVVGDEDATAGSG
jgi:hypothetical protein